MPDKQIRVAMIGATGHFMLRPIFRAASDIKLVAYASDGHGGVHPQADADDLPRFEDFRRMLEEVRPDAVSLGCWYAHNGEVALECLRRGIHVVTDKPALNTWDELGEAVEVCAANPDLKFITEFAYRSHALFLAAREVIASGQIGRPVLVTAQKSYKFGDRRPDFYRSRAHYAGTLMWVASHAIDWVTWLTGLPYLSFYGHQGNLSRPEYDEMEDHVSLAARMDKGVSAMITADFLRPAAAPSHSDDRCRVAGTGGIIEVKEGRCVVMTADRAPENLTAEGDEEAGSRAMAETLRGGGDGTYGTAETLRSARFLLAARDALDQRREIVLDGTR